MTLRNVALTGLGVLVGSGLVLAATPLGRDVLFHAVPIRWTGEAERLAAALRLAPGGAFADIGAGDGALAVELARHVGSGGRAFATERTSEQRQRIAKRATRAGVALTVIEAADGATNLPDACCDAITMRMVLHHVGEPEPFARDLRRSVRRGGRVGIIDFAPGALPHLADDHGVGADRVIEAFTAAGFVVEASVDRWGGRTFLIVFRAT
jgi:SAM-dependent methyltransferase